MHLFRNSGAILMTFVVTACGGDECVIDESTKTITCDSGNLTIPEAPKVGPIAQWVCSYSDPVVVDESGILTREYTPTSTVIYEFQDSYFISCTTELYEYGVASGATARDVRTSTAWWTKEYEGWSSCTSQTILHLFSAASETLTYRHGEYSTPDLATGSCLRNYVF